MFLRRRNVTAYILILFSIFCWVLGQELVNSQNYGYGNIVETSQLVTWETTTIYLQGTQAAEAESNKVTEPAGTDTMGQEDSRPEAQEGSRLPDQEVSQPSQQGSIGTSVQESIEAAVKESSQPPGQRDDSKDKAKNNFLRIVGAALYLISIAAAITAVVILWQQEPLFGPDGASLLAAIFTMVYSNSQIQYFRNYYASPAKMIVKTVGFIILLIVIRELYGWIRAKMKLSWCFVYRIAKHLRLPQTALLTYVVYIILVLAGCLFCCYQYMKWHIFYQIPMIAFGAAIALFFVCLWRYGSDLNHLKKQLDNFQDSKPINVGDGIFSGTEAQLLDVQAKHEEAVRTAVSSERFKVELISNVSHDLRTPLTSILGYSELLKNEKLSEEGKEQLRSLNQKAGYMNDLVEALFELTKVSSGAVECKQEEIDLIRLLEQTIGLFDDQLNNSGLCVRRNYSAESIPVITDGARMHQVFANLLGNAIKYALAGTRIYLDVAEKEKCYHIRMMNTASYEMDFKPDEIVQRFARGDKARTTKGSGLGLAIAKTYTESVGGSFYVSVDGDQFSANVELPKIETSIA